MPFILQFSQFNWGVIWRSFDVFWCCSSVGWVWEETLSPGVCFLVTEVLIIPKASCRVSGAGIGVARDPSRGFESSKSISSSVHCQPANRQKGITVSTIRSCPGLVQLNHHLSVCVFIDLALQQEKPGSSSENAVGRRNFICVKDITLRILTLWGHPVYQLMAQYKLLHH